MWKLVTILEQHEWNLIYCDLVLHLKAKARGRRNFNQVQIDLEGKMLDKRDD